MFRYVLLSSLLVLGIAKSYVFYIERSVITLKKRINRQNELLNLLKVEWTYLNQNSRLQKLANIYLKNWQPIEPMQMKNIEQVKLDISNEEKTEDIKIKNQIKTQDSLKNEQNVETSNIENNTQKVKRKKSRKIKVSKNN